MEISNIPDSGPIKRPGEEDGKNLAVLAESISQLGWSDIFSTLTLGESKKTLVRRPTEFSWPKGPGVLFVAFLPAEAFEDEHAIVSEGAPEVANAEPDEGLDE